MCDTLNVKSMLVLAFPDFAGGPGAEGLKRILAAFVAFSFQKSCVIREATFSFNIPEDV